MKKVIPSTEHSITISKDELISMIPFVEGAVYQDLQAKDDENPIVYVKVTTSAYRVEAYDIATDEVVYVDKDDDYTFIGWLDDM